MLLLIMPFLFEGIKQKFRYFGDMSNLHGVRHVFSRSQIPFLKRCFWASILMACCVGAGAILKSSLSLFTTNAASYSVLTDYLDWDTPFPAVTVCEQSDNGRVKAFLNQFHRVDTEYGPCFVFNSALTNTTLYTVNRRVGLPNLIFSAVELVGIRIHSPEDIVSTKMENILGRFASLPLVTNFDAILKVEQTVNSATVKTISPSARGCLFSHEAPDFGTWPFHRYTYSRCLLYCRGLAQNGYCNCTHHFLANIVKIPACDVTGLACLYQNKDQILKFKCTCPMVCEDVQYNAVHVFFNRVSKTPSELMSRGTRARIRIAQLPSLRVLRFAIRDNLGLAVDIGGVVGVFFGASLLSVVEVVYLFCIRRN